MREASETAEEPTRGRFPGNAGSAEAGRPGDARIANDLHITTSRRQTHAEACAESRDHGRAAPQDRQRP